MNGSLLGLIGMAVIMAVFVAFVRCVLAGNVAGIWNYGPQAMIICALFSLWGA